MGHGNYWLHLACGTVNSFNTKCLISGRASEEIVCRDTNYDPRRRGKKDRSIAVDNCPFPRPLSLNPSGSTTHGSDPTVRHNASNGGRRHHATPPTNKQSVIPVTLFSPRRPRPRAPRPFDADDGAATSDSRTGNRSHFPLAPRVRIPGFSYSDAVEAGSSILRRYSSLLFFFSASASSSPQGEACRRRDVIDGRRCAIRRLVVGWEDSDHLTSDHLRCRHRRKAGAPALLAVA